MKKSFALLSLTVALFVGVSASAAHATTPAKLHVILPIAIAQPPFKKHPHPIIIGAPVPATTVPATTATIQRHF